MKLAKFCAFAATFALLSTPADAGDPVKLRIAWAAASGHITLGARLMAGN